MAYSNKVVDHYENPRNVGSFNPSDNNVGTGLVGAPIKQTLDNHLGIA
jgi:nitrogen fixation NifU-like protein